MNSKRFFFIMLGVLVVLGGGVLASVYLGNSLLQKQSDKLVSLKLDSQVADQQQNSLIQAKKDIQTYSDLSEASKAIVPQDKDQAETVREIVKIAYDNGSTNEIDLGSITFPSSNLGLATTKSSSTSTESKTPTISQVQAVNGIKGLYVMPITIQSNASKPITYDAFINFLHNLENNRRTAQVSSVNITPDKNNGNFLSFILTLNVYIKP